jgi:hypothetical protein
MSYTSVWSGSLDKKFRTLNIFKKKKKELDNKL